MGHWISDLSLKYKFWAVNAVAFFTTLLLVLYALQLEQQDRAAGIIEAGEYPGSSLHDGLVPIPKEAVQA